MNLVVTGASGFLGRALVRRLLDDGTVGGGLPPIRRLTLVARNMEAAANDARVRVVKGDIRDAAVRAAMFEGGVDCLFHLAAVLIVQTEPNYELGRSINLDASLALFDELRRHSRARVVFASTIGVYGSPLPASVDDDTVPRPTLSYGAQKLVVETYLTDLARRGFLDGRTIRIPGTVPRPRLPDRAYSPAFTSNMFHALAAREPFDCPVSASATGWYLSHQQSVENLLHAARLPEDRLTTRRVWMMPALRLSMGEVLDALAARLGDDVRKLVTWNPIAALETEMGSFPPLTTAAADHLGFRHDGAVNTLVERTLALLQARQVH